MKTIGYADSEWDVGRAIREQIAKEDKQYWLSKQEEPFIPIKIPFSVLKWSQAVAYAFGRGVYRETRSFVRP